MPLSEVQPFYNPNISFDENYHRGPFGDFARQPTEGVTPSREFELFGHRVGIPFGIPAGPLINSNYIEAAWWWGFDVATYKTVRGESYPCHPAPNVIKLRTEGRDVHPGDRIVGDLDTSTLDVAHEGITNSFGVPSQPPEVWQDDVRAALGKMNDGRLLILSFMGTKKEGMTPDQYAADFVRTASLAKATGAPVLEVNFSCPNVGKEGLICNDVDTSANLLEAMKSARGSVPLLVKIGYFSHEAQDDLVNLLEAIHQFADGVVAINTIQATVVGEDGKQILPGSPVRLQSGVCGAVIRWAGLEMAKRIVTVKRDRSWKDFVVVGVGGVITPSDYIAYMNEGVDAVQSATGAMWRPALAREIREAVASS